MSINTFYSREKIPYTGSELRPHFILQTFGKKFGVRGSSLVAFRGRCDVQTSELVDWEDRLDEAAIRSKEMLHFLGEFFGPSLREMVFFQRLFTSIIRDELEEMAKKQFQFLRKGDDVFCITDSNSGASRKVTVSIVTASPVSCLMHFGINIDPEGAPVPALGLAELDISSEEFAMRVLERVKLEWESIDWACAKVRPVF